MANKYDPESEHVADINMPEIRDRIEEAKTLYESLSDECNGIDLRDEGANKLAFERAKESGAFRAAEKLTTLLFGPFRTTYGVSYISDSCVSGCTYCPIRKDSRDVKTGKPIARRTLRLEDFKQDTQEIIDDGHSHICFLTGDGNLTYKNPERLIPYLQVADGMEGIVEIILNVTPQTTDVFREWRKAVKNKSLQFRVFQETYDREIYAQKHPCGPKADYDFRRDSQDRALEAGFDNYGLGILLGLNSNPLQDLDEMVRHAIQLTEKYGKRPARVCLPTANTLAGVNNVEQQYHVSPRVNELVYVLARLAMPDVSLVSSERDTPEMLRKLDRYATNRTVDVQPSVGGNLMQRRRLERGGILKQTTVYPTNPTETARDYEQRGYELRFRY